MTEELEGILKSSMAILEDGEKQLTSIMDVLKSNRTLTKREQEVICNCTEGLGFGILKLGTSLIKLIESIEGEM